MIIKGGATSVTTYFALRLTVDGTAATGLTPADFDLQYVRSGVAPAAKIDATALAQTDSAHADNKCIEIDATDQPGLYRVDWPDAAFAANVKEVILSVKVATAFTEHLRVELSPDINIISINGDADAAMYLERDYNGTGFNKSNSTIGTATVVNGFANDAITAASINTGAFTADAFAADALVAATFATGAFTADVFAADSIVAATLATGALTADAFAANALVAGTFATDWFTAAGLKADAVTEIQNGLGTEAKQDTAQTDLDTLTDARGEPGQGAPAVSASTNLKIDYLYKNWRNKKTQTATAANLLNDAGDTIDQTSVVSDDGTTFTKGEIISG